MARSMLTPGPMSWEIAFVFGVVSVILVPLNVILLVVAALLIPVFWGA